MVISVLTSAFLVSSPTVSNEEVTDSVKAPKSAKLRNIPDEAVEDLVKLVHRNPNNKLGQFGTLVLCSLGAMFGLSFARL